MKKHYWKIAFVLFMLSIIFIILPIAELLGLHLIDNKSDLSISHLNAASVIILTFLLAILTAALVYVAWHQLKGIQETQRADFLMRIDTRYGSNASIKARIYIHELYLSTQGTTKEISKTNLSREIQKLFSDAESIHKYIYILNFFELLETIAFFTNNKYLSSKEVNGLIGGSLTYFHEIFTLLKNHIQATYDNGTYYFKELDTLIPKLKAEQNPTPPSDCHCKCKCNDDCC